MIKNFRDAQVFYRFFDKKTEVVNVFLHGWGCNHTSFLFCHKALEKQSSLFVDFPPFGQSSKTISDWTVFTYANMVHSLVQSLGIKKINLIGHSFGGRIAIILAVLCKEEINKIVLVDAAGVKPRRKLSYYFKVFSYKLRKKLGKNVSHFGSSDYLALSPNMRKIFVSIVSTHLDDFLPFISAPTLIIFGKNDTTTPVYMAKKLNRKIANSQLVLLEDAGHFCFAERRLEFLSELKKFLLQSAFGQSDTQALRKNQLKALTEI